MFVRSRGRVGFFVRMFCVFKSLSDGSKFWMITESVYHRYDEGESPYNEFTLPNITKSHVMNSCVSPWPVKALLSRGRPDVMANTKNYSLSTVM